LVVVAVVTIGIVVFVVSDSTIMAAEDVDDVWLVGCMEDAAVAFVVFVVVGRSDGGKVDGIVTGLVVGSIVLDGTAVSPAAAAGVLVVGKMGVVLLIANGGATDVGVVVVFFVLSSTARGAAAAEVVVVVVVVFFFVLSSTARVVVVVEEAVVLFVVVAFGRILEGLDFGVVFNGTVVVVALLFDLDFSVVAVVVLDFWETDLCDTE
jgi:hypothetical protein